MELVFFRAHIIMYAKHTVKTLKLSKFMKFLFQIRCVGRMQENWQKEAIHMFTTRCQPFCNIEILELPEGHQKSAKPDINKTLKTEAESLLKNIADNTFLIALDQNGKQLTSESFANLISGRHAKFKIQDTKFVFLIGGSWGLDESVKKRADLLLSLSDMTLPHSLARIFLIEQIYRALSIINNKNYHK